MDNKAHNLIRGQGRWRRGALLLAAVIAVICLSTLLISLMRGPRAAHLPDGSVLTISDVTVGTNHVVYRKPWHRVIQAIPFLPKRVYVGTEPFGWRSSSPCLVVWCSWRGLTPTSPPPEFHFVDEGGTESPPLEKGQALSTYKDLTTVSEVRGIFGASKSVPRGKVIRIRIYQADRNQTRVRAADLEFKNPSRAP